VGQHCSLTRCADTSTENTILAQLESLHCCTTRLIPIWFQYDIPTNRTPRRARCRTRSRRSCTSCVSNPISTPNHMSHMLRVHNSTCTTCEPPNAIFQRRFIRRLTLTPEPPGGTTRGARTLKIRGFSGALARRNCVLSSKVQICST